MYVSLSCLFHLVQFQYHTYLSHLSFTYYFVICITVTATLVAKEFAKGDTNAVQDAISQAIMAGTIIAAVMTPLLYLRPEVGLASVLKVGSAPAMKYAKPYLMIRAFAFLPGILSLVGFSAYRGTLDMVTPVKITFVTNMLNMIMDPICIFTLGMGVSGAAFATLASEILGAIVYIRLLIKKKLLNVRKLFKLPSWAQLEPLLRGGLAMQLRLVAMVRYKIYLQIR